MAFRVLIRILTSIIKILNEEGFKLYDSENHDWYISNVRYCKEDDRLYFDTLFDEKAKEENK